jgi:hypothetical protein
VDLANATDGLSALKALIDTLDTVADAIKAETDKLTLGDAGAGSAGSIIEEIENRPTTAMRGTDNVVLSGPTKAEMDTGHGSLATTADLLDKLGAVDEAAAADDPSATESVMQYVKQIINILIGAAGIANLRAAAAPANNVSLSEMIRAIFDDSNSLDGTKIPDTLSLANINAEVDTALVTTTYAEPAQGQPGNTLSIEEKISIIYAALINKVDVDATLKEFYNAAGTVIWKKTLADDGTNYNEAKGATGP